MSSLTGVTSMKNASIATYKTRRSYYTASSTGASKGISSEKTKKKKSPRYSFKQVSSQILRAKNSLGAAQAYQAARRKLGELRRLSGNTTYDQEEVEIAIRHAESMLRIARKKRNHLADEERAEHERKSRETRDELTEKVEDSLRDGNNEGFLLTPGEDVCEETDPFSSFAEEDGLSLCDESGFDPEAADSAPDLSDPGEDLTEMTEEFSEEMAAELEDTLRELEDEMAKEEQMEALSEFISPHATEEDLEEIKKKHRAKEQLEITKADMKYLKAMFEKYQRERSESPSAGYSSGGRSEPGSMSGMHLSVSVSTTSADTVPAEGGTIDVSA